MHLKTHTMNLGKDLTEKLSELAEAYDVADVYVFGSRAAEIAAMVKGGGKSAERTKSDVDIAIRPFPGRRLTPGEIVGLALALEDVLGVTRVDLVVLPDADPFLALNIIRGELIFTRDALSQARYELYVLRRAGDLAGLKKARMEMIMEGHGR